MYPTDYFHDHHNLSCIESKLIACLFTSKVEKWIDDGQFISFIWRQHQMFDFFQTDTYNDVEKGKNNLLRNMRRTRKWFVSHHSWAFISFWLWVNMILSIYISSRQRLKILQFEIKLIIKCDLIPHFEFLFCLNVLIQFKNQFRKEFI